MNTLELIGRKKELFHSDIKKFEEDQIIKMYQSSSDKREFNLVLAH